MQPVKKGHKKTLHTETREGETGRGARAAAHPPPTPRPSPVAARAAGPLALPRARAGGLAGSVFAIFTPSPGPEPLFAPLPGGGYDAPLAAPVPHAEAAAHATSCAGRLLALERPGHVRIARE